MLIFCKKNADISKIEKVVVLKSIFSETKYVCVLTYQFQVSSLVLTGFRRVLPPTPKGTPKKLTLIRVKWFVTNPPILYFLCERNTHALQRDDKIKKIKKTYFSNHHELR